MTSMSDTITTDEVGDEAFFRVVSTHHLASRSIYVLGGEIESGIIRPDMQVEIDLNSGLNVFFDISGIEFMRKDNGELVALTLKVEDVETVSFLDALELSGERIRIISANRLPASNVGGQTS